MHAVRYDVVERCCCDVVRDEKDHSYACEAYYFPALEVKTQFSLHRRSSSLPYTGTLQSAYIGALNIVTFFFGRCYISRVPPRAQE
jgi:hypothetical protein